MTCGGMTHDLNDVLTDINPRSKRRIRGGDKTEGRPTCYSCYFDTTPGEIDPCKSCIQDLLTGKGKTAYTPATVPTSTASQCGACKWAGPGCCQETAAPSRLLDLTSDAPSLAEKAIADAQEWLTSRPESEVPTRGLRYNKGKRRYDLIPPDALAVIADILTKGAEKYAPRNWELGMPYSDALASLERHLQTWKAGEDNDAESTLSHLGHVAINAIFLLTWQMRGVGEDDRVKVEMPLAPATRA